MKALIVNFQALLKDPKGNMMVIVAQLPPESPDVISQEHLYDKVLTEMNQKMSKEVFTKPTDEEVDRFLDVLAELPPDQVKQVDLPDEPRVDASCN